MMRIILLILIIIPLALYAQEREEPIINYRPNSYIINIDEENDLKFDLNTNVVNSKELFSGVEGIIMEVYYNDSSIPIDNYKFESVNDLRQFMYRPKQIGNYRFSFTTIMKSEYIYDETIPIKVIPIGGVPTLTPVDIKYNGPFIVDVPIPDNVYKGLDIAFIVDNSGSMGNEIYSTKIASSNIFSMFKDQVADVKASVITFADFKYNQSTYTYEPDDYTVVISPTSFPEKFDYIPTITTGGKEYQFYALYKTAKNRQLWRDGSLKLMILMTDEPDNVYCHEGDDCINCDYNKKVLWGGNEQLSISDINNYLRNNDYTIAVLYNEINGRICYGSIMKKNMGHKYSGEYHIPNDSNSSQQIVRALNSSFQNIVNSTVIDLVPLFDENNIIEKIEPLAPQKCIDKIRKGFRYKCAKESGYTVKYRIRVNENNVVMDKYNFLLAVKTDKGSLVAVKPVTIKF